MKALVVGYGSIGQRHTAILMQLGVEVGVVSTRDIDFSTTYKRLSEALDDMQPNYVVIANKTSDHYKVLLELIENKWEGAVLVEKPVYDEIRVLPSDHKLRILVAYNLRFHPLLRRLKQELQFERILSMTIYAGQYLPDWRPQRDYRLSYSSSRSEGGGVIRDLSHELDYLLWLCGEWKRVSALGGKFSSLEITGEDVCGVLVELEQCPLATLQVNYMDRPGRREIVVVTDEHTYRVDMRNAFFERDGNVEQVSLERNDTYIAQHNAILQGESDIVCSLEEGESVVRFFKAIEHSIATKEWIKNE